MVKERVGSLAWLRKQVEAAGLLSEAAEEILAFTGFPDAVWQQWYNEERPHSSLGYLMSV